MRVVVTRPPTSAEATAARLRALGHEPVLLPLTVAVHKAIVWADILVEEPVALAATSAEAIRALSTAGPIPEHLLSTPLFSVGPATSSAARDAGFLKIIESQGSGKELAVRISEDCPPTSEKSPLLYIAGTPRASGLEAGLAESGAVFRTVEVYRMEDIAHAPATVRRALFDPAAAVVLLYSRANAERFLALPFEAEAREGLQTLRFACLSPNIAEALPDNLRHRAVVAANPDEDTLFRLLEKQM
jgi:uroporphyrinogen-III synthase